MQVMDKDIAEVEAEKKEEDQEVIDPFTLLEEERVVLWDEDEYEYYDQDDYEF